MTKPAADRAHSRAAFLDAAGWGKAAATALTADASTRSYERLWLGGRSALLMNAPPAAEGAACPVDASPKTRRRLGYNAMARLAGPNLHAYMAIAKTLRAAGLSAPEVFAADPARGFALIEDLGDDLYVRAIPKGAEEKTLYEAAVDALLRLHAARPAPPQSPQYTMLSYDRTALEAEIGLLIEWYWPHRLERRAKKWTPVFRKNGATTKDSTASCDHDLSHDAVGGPAPASLAADYFAAWASVLDRVSAPCDIILRDYHAENLLWLADREGPRRVGIIDFQDGLVGCAAYDLVSLLEDARRDVDLTLAEAMIERYIEGAGAQNGFDEAAFRCDYAILAAQRNTKILGIFARLVNRDKKPRYLDFLPRVEAHFRRDLQRAPLAPVRAFFAAHFPDLAP